MNCRACGWRIEAHPILIGGTGGMTRCEYFVDPDTNGIGSAELKLSDDWPGWPEEPRTAPAKYEPYALTHAEVLTKRRAEIARVQPAFEKAWKAWQDPSPRNLWWRKYYHIFG